MNYNNIHVTIYNTTENKLYFDVISNGTPHLKFTVKPIPLESDTIVFTIDSITPYKYDTDAMSFITVIGILYYITTVNLMVFYNLIPMTLKPNIMFGMDKYIAPAAILSNEEFLESLRMENMLDYDTTFQFIIPSNEIIMFNLEGMQCLYDMYIPEEGITMYFKN